MSGRFAGKVVMITGAASGFGALAAKRFAAEGAQLALSDIHALSFDGALTQQLDVRDEAHHQDHVRRCLERYGRLDIAINNAGIASSMKPITQIDLDDYRRVMDVNVQGVFLGMKQQLPPMIAQGDGCILNVASAAGLVGAAMMSAYAASKHAVVGLTKSVADEVARKGVRVNALCPAFAETPLFAAVSEAQAKRGGLSRDDVDARITARIPMRRVAGPDEIVQAMLWACDPANSFMTGQALGIDGGLTAV